MPFGIKRGNITERHNVPSLFRATRAMQYAMTPELLARDWLSFRFWAVKCVLPTAAALLVILGLFTLVTDSPKDLDHNAVIVGFFALYFVLVRGGHIVMVRSLHKELLRKYRDGYIHKLGYIPQGQIKRRNIGFTLARIKRELMIEAQEKKAKPFG